MGRELTMGESSTKLDRQQQNFSAHILLSWSVVLQGRPARQNGGDHDWLIQTPVSTVQWDMSVPPDADSYAVPINFVKFFSGQTSRQVCAGVFILGI